jgi:hypothetical protein
MPPETPDWLDFVVEDALPRPTTAVVLLDAVPVEPARAADHGPPTTVLAPLAFEPAPAELLVPPPTTMSAKAGEAAKPSVMTDARRIFFILQFPLAKNAETGCPGPQRCSCRSPANSHFYLGWSKYLLRIVSTYY